MNFRHFLRRSAFLGVFLMGHTVQALEYWIDPSAIAGGDGTAGRPFLSMDEALSAMQLVRSDDEWTPEPVTFVLQGGDHFRAEPLLLRPEDGGGAGYPITIKAAPGAKPRWVGGRIIDQWVPIGDSHAAERVPAEARPHVVVADLARAGITDFGTIKSRGFKRYENTGSALELFFNDEPMTLARWPNEGFTHIAGYPPESATKSLHGIPRGALEAGFYYSGDRPSRWADPENVWMHGYWMWDWADTHERIQSIDLDKKLIRTAPPYGFQGFRTGQRYYYQNILEELDAPGEWYLDRDQGLLYFWPPSPIEKGEAMVSVVEGAMIQLRSVDYVTVDGIEFTASRGMAISILGGRHNQIINCVMKNLGVWALEVLDGTHHRVVGCTIRNTGDGGINAQGGDRQTLQPGHIEIVGNRIERIARWNRCYRQGVNVSGVGNRVAHNLIHDIPHCAIALSGNDHVIEYNEIHHACMESGDVGAIYTGRDYTWRGNVIRFNYIHDLGGVNMGSMGIYLDDMVSGFQVYGNIFARLKYGIYMGGGRDNLLINNSFYQCEESVHLDGRGMDPQANWRWMVNAPMRERYYAMNPLNPPYIDKYPELRSIDPYFQEEDAYIPPEGTVVDRNVSDDPDGLAINRPEQVMDFIAIKENYWGADVGFVNPEQGDFRLREDSPAKSTGFKTIPRERIGPDGANAIK